MNNRENICKITQDFQTTNGPWNGILRCYNLFPRQFPNIDAMRLHLTEVAAMGFNVVWINPIQQTGEVFLFPVDKNNGVWEGNKAKQSLYAMKDPLYIDRHFSVAPRTKEGDLACSPQEALALDMQALKAFTAAAKNLGLRPIFDLVMNHVAADAPLCQQYPHWFLGRDPSYQDAQKFNYQDDKIREEIIALLWKPYIARYINSYGFQGVRVDAVWHLHPKLREVIYPYIRGLLKEKSLSPIIFEEALFNHVETEVMIKQLLLPSCGPTHITSVTYYAKTDPETGDLPLWVKEDNGQKLKVVFQTAQGQIRTDLQGGTVNFTGNHDHQSLAMKVVQDLAEQNLMKEPLLAPLLEKLKNSERNTEREESRYNKLLFIYVKEILEKRSCDQALNNLILEGMRERLILAAFTASAGWYLLSGDEYGDLNAKSVFLRENEGPFYPLMEQAIFSDLRPEIKEAVERCLEEMALERIKLDAFADELGNLYNMHQALKDNQLLQKKCLTAYVDTLRRQINANEKIIAEDFHQRLQACLTIDFKIEEANRSTFTKNSSEMTFNLHEDIKEINAILSQLRPPKHGFWSEVLKHPKKPSLVVIVRKNGYGLDSETDLIIMNKRPDVRIAFDKTLLHELACAFQRRVIPKEEQFIGNSYFNKAYETIMQAGLYLCPRGIQNQLEAWSFSPKEQFCMFAKKPELRIEDKALEARIFNDLQI